jgi:2-polyprenyl-6-methoxyphenol hydroxylase-like FAD-dependent oxidoreductase
MTELKILIIGAGMSNESTPSSFIASVLTKQGTSGLLIAQGLKKYSIDFELFERESSDVATKRPRDWSMALQWGSSHFSACLPAELHSKLPSIQGDPFYEADHGIMPDVPFRNGATGEILASVPAKGLWRVSRSKMQTLFSEGLDVQYEKKLVGIIPTSKSVTATFADGSTATGTHLVGADGAKSFLRTLLLGPERAALTTLPVAMYNFKTSFPTHQALYLKNKFHPIMNFAIHPTTDTLFMISILDMPNRNDPQTWVWQIFFSMMGEENQKEALRISSQERLAMFKEEKEMWVEPWKSVMSWVREGTNIPADRCMFWKEPVKWDSRHGRVTLAGDAAHAMPPCKFSWAGIDLIGG